MKQILSTVFLLCAWWSSTCQIDIQVTTLDSFNTSAIGQQGVYGLYSTTWDSLIHLSYFYSDHEANTYLLYSIRGENSFLTDTVLEIPDYIKSLSNTAIQFDSAGIPWIYAGFNSNNTRMIKAYTRTDTSWIESFSLNQLGTPDQYVASAPHGKEIGFAFCGVRIPPANHYPIEYASFDGSQWHRKIISEVGKSEKTKPSMVSQNDKLYLCFAESRCPDTLITRVYVKEDSTWSISFEDIWSGEYDCDPLSSYATKLGADKGGVYLLQDIHLDDPHPQLFRLTDTTWDKAPVLFDTEWVHPFTIGSNIHLDPFHSVYWINQEKQDKPGLSYIRTDGGSGYIALPHEDYNITLQDMTFLKGWIYIYYFEGSYNWPWGKPITFKEARVQISKITGTQKTEIPAPIQLNQNVPNPFSTRSTITFSLPHSMNVDLTVFDFLGNPVQTLVSGYLAGGLQSYWTEGTELPAGVYFYRLSAGNQLFTRPMIVSH